MPGAESVGIGMHMLFEILWIIFWVLTYAAIIYYEFKYRDSDYIFMPLLAGSLNFACEIVSLIVKLSVGNGWIAHVLCLFLDLFILIYNINILRKRKGHPVLYVVFTGIATILLYFIFTLPNIDGMLLSIFIIDLEMAVVYLLKIKSLPPPGRLSIGVLRFLGDLFAWIAYIQYSTVVFVIGAIVTLLNLIYITYCKELSSVDSGSEKSTHSPADSQKAR